MSGRAGSDDRRASGFPHETKFRDSTAASWLLGVILLLLVIWVASLLIVPEESTDSAPRAPVRTIASSQAFSAWVRDSLPSDGADLDDRTVLDALRRLNIAQASVVARVAPDLQPRLATVDSLLLEFDAHIAAGAAADSRHHVADALRESWQTLVELRQWLRRDAAPGTAQGLPAPEPVSVPDATGLDAAVAEAGLAASAVDPAAARDEFRSQVQQAVRALAAGLAAVAGAAGAP